MQVYTNNIVKIELECDGTAKEVSVGFCPTKVEVIRKDTGHMATCFKDVAKCVKMTASAALVNSIVEFDATKITLKTDSDLNVDTKEVILLCYR